LTKDIVPLARIFPDRRAVAGQDMPSRRVLTSRQKAAVIVRYLLTEGTSLPLASLPEHMQAALAEQMGQMRLIDQTTLDEVVAQFLTELESVGLSFPGGIEGALTMMDGHISQSAASRLRRMASTSSKFDPWERITALPVERLMPILRDEAAEVGAVMLSSCRSPRLPTSLAACPATARAGWPMPFRRPAASIPKPSAALARRFWQTSTTSPPAPLTSGRSNGWAPS
jgi:flagellar motor switch protein FliG